MLGLTAAMWVAGLWLAMVLAAVALEKMAGKPVPLCMFKRITGYPCATCGSTRAVMATARGDIVGAFALNPLVMTVLVGGPVVVIWRVMAARRRARLGLPVVYWSPAQRIVAWIVAIGLLAANWGYVVWRGN